jgi:hypothetical protein
MSEGWQLSYFYDSAASKHLKLTQVREYNYSAQLKTAALTGAVVSLRHALAVTLRHRQSIVSKETQLLCKELYQE